MKSIDQTDSSIGSSYLRKRHEIRRGCIPQDFPRLLAVTLCVGSLVSILQSQTRQPSPPKPASSLTAAEGQQVFASRCASCHGLDGRGGERAPDIAAKREVQRLSDAELFRIIQNGIPESGMPGFRSLGDSGIKAVVTYLRALQGISHTAAPPGDPQKGKSVFFGKAKCSDCHMASGDGGFIAGDLSSYAQTHSAGEIREAILDPGKNADSRQRFAVVATRSGEQYAGMVRNEDNFSLQLQTLDGKFHFFAKSELQKVEYQPQSQMMPADYGSTLSRQELDDVVSYLVSVAKTSKSDASSGEEVDQ